MVNLVAGGGILLPLWIQGVQISSASPACAAVLNLRCYIMLFNLGYSCKAVYMKSIGDLVYILLFIP